MPFPAARVAVSHVGSARGSRPDLDACLHAEIGGVLRCGQPEYRPIRQQVLPSLQRPDLRSVCAATAATPQTWQTNDRRARQCCIPPRSCAGSAAAEESACADISISAAIQPTTVVDRTGLEAHPAIGHAQSILRNTPSRSRGRYRLFPQMGTAKQRAAKAMLHYLRRCV
jgi:hypothetical protein